MIVITVANQKGGVGKTTTAVHLSHHLSIQGKKILLIDLDPQGQCSTSLGLSPSPDVYDLLISKRVRDPFAFVRATGRERLDIISGDSSTGTLQMLMAAENRPLSAIGDAIKPFRGVYDYVLLDTPPSVGGLQERALWAANLVIIPTQPEYLSLEGVAQITALMKKMWGLGWTGKLLGVLLTHFDEQTRESKASRDSLRGSLGEAALLPPIHRATVMREAAARGLTIYEYAPGSRSAQEYAALAQRIAR